MRAEPVFRLFACCVPVRGARRSTVCDLQRHAYRFIPNVLFEILTEHAGKTPAQLEALYGEGSRPVLDEYFAFLEGNELGFWCDDPDAFPLLDLSWDRPEQVTNAVIDVDAGSAHPWATLLGELDGLGCRALQLRFFDAFTLDEVEAVLEHTRAGRLRSIDLLLRHDPAWTDAELEGLCMRHQRISQVLVHSAPEDRVARTPRLGTPLCYRRQVVDSSAHCGHVNPTYFAITVEAFTEAQAYNSCLNRKIAVDARGAIRNCPAMPRSFGTAGSTPLRRALEQPEFREAWSIHKDQVETCRDCEFRYVCTDCRAFVRDPANPYSKPARCGYDPYTATWHQAEPAELAAAAAA